MTSPSRQKKKVVVLGGGTAAMTAAYYLSHTQSLRDELDVTVYQMGWRLGGKGASGRNRERFNRIEEHGLHVWGGFYYNAFRTMERCYERLGRPPGAPLRRWNDAFTPHSFVAWEEWVDGHWRHWPIPVPTTDDTPGEGGELPSAWGYIEMLVGWLKDVVVAFPHDEIRRAVTASQEKHCHPRWLRRLLDDAGSSLAHVVDDTPRALVELAHHEVKKLARQTTPHRARDHHGVLALLKGFHDWLKTGWMETIAAHDESRRLFILMDAVQAMVRGMIRDGVVVRGFMAIDDEELTHWLARHGAHPLTLESAPLRGYYDYFFAYENGDPERPRMSAGMGLHHLLRLVATYKGALFWKMQSGMGDAVFGPLYQACKANGVRFRFFHRVRELSPAPGGHRIESVTIGRQVDLTVPEYEPLFDVNGLPSWPSAPLTEQIAPDQARELERRGANLEDPWTDWDDVETITLEADKDFDAIVLGISIGSFPFVCRKLIDTSDVWDLMVQNLQTIQTQALQLWWTKTVDELGWKMGNATGTAYAQPLESWSDMSEVIPREEWPATSRPGSVIYFCGPMKNPERMPEGKDPGYGEAESAKAARTAFAWSRENVHHLFPGASVSGEPHELDYDLLVDPGGASGRARFDAQYARANYTPSERYVLDLPGTARFRLEADTSGLDNLALAGDWLFTGLGGSVESAVIAGMQAARGLTGEPETIVGEIKNPWRRERSLKKISGG